MAVSANRLELLQIADAVAREKSIDRMIVVTAMEDAIQKAARSRYGQETDVRAEINPKTGEIKLQRLLKVAHEIDNTATDILVEDARRRNPAAQPGDYIAEPLPLLRKLSHEERRDAQQQQAWNQKNVAGECGYKPGRFSGFPE